MLIIPLLQLIGVDTGIKPNEGIVNLADKAFGILGISPSLNSVLISYVVIATLIATIRYSLAVINTSIRQAYICWLRSSLYRYLLYSCWEFVLSRRMPEFIHSLTVQVQSVGQVAHLLLGLVSQVILCGILGVLAFLLSWKMSLLALLFFGVLLVFLFPLNKLIYRSGHDELINYKSIFQLLTEQLASLKMIKSYASEKYYADRLQAVSEVLEEQLVRFGHIQAFTLWVYMVGTVVGFSVFFYVARTYLNVSVATTLLLLIIFSRILPQVLGIQKNCQQLLHRAPALKDVNAMRSECIEHREIVKSCGLKPPRLEKCICIDNIGYAYPQRIVPVFQHFSTTIEHCQTVALVGPSGAGKSTLADLIAGLLIPQSGTIYCDGVSLTGARRLVWRESVAYVTQEIFFFNDTIRANLDWVNKGADERDLWGALKLAAAEEYVSELPQGLDTVIGDRGVRLSGGERQRLALARAILSKPRLLILDEATSALDSDNELLIQQSLKQLHGRLTILIIAHRETTILHADKKISLPKYFTKDPSKKVDTCIATTS